MLEFVKDKYPAAWPWIQLMRLDRPIGTLLLLWPTLWAVWIAGEGAPSVKHVLIFVIGVIVMRAAGCVINDYADRNLDGQVERTKERPLATGKLEAKQALMLFDGLAVIAFVLVLFLNRFTIYLSFGGIFLAALYPFMKRYTYFPQVFLGAAFAWAIPMAFAAIQDALPSYAWLIYLATLIWTVAYDTQYAMVDRDDDLKAGIRSTAILFGDSDKLMIGILQAMALLPLYLLGQRLGFGVLWNAGLLVAIGLFAYQQWLIRNRERDACFKAFLNNQWVGLAIFAGLVGQYLMG
jgi:4-hydroxybenzoate polyprenyltransferase